MFRKVVVPDSIYKTHNCVVDTGEQAIVREVVVPDPIYKVQIRIIDAHKQ